jgi:hypothetical protein
MRLAGLGSWFLELSVKTSAKAQRISPAEEFSRYLAPFSDFLA